MRMYRHARFTFLSVCSAIAVLSLALPVWALTWGPLDAQDVIERSKTVTPAKYPDADVVIVAQQAWTEYAEDGTYVEWFEQYVKVLTEKGRRRHRTITSSFTIPYNTTRFALVEVITKDGGIRTIDVEKNSREMVDSSQMASNIYNPNDRLLQVSIPGLGIGDTVHFITHDEFVKARMAGEFSDFSTFEGIDPVVYDRITIIAPESKPLRSIALKNEIPGSVQYSKTDHEDAVVYQWIARDIPRAFEEPEMPPLYTQAQRLLVSTIPDWETVSRWYWNLSAPHLEKTTGEMRSTVRKLITGKKTRTERIEAIFFWVSQEIRYLGITAETEAPGYEPHPVSMTYDRRAGVCRDKAALLVAMLRMAGIEAYPVLIMNGPRKDPEVPQPFFNHAIAAVRNKDGSYILMDPTDENTRELLPSYLNNQSYLVARPSGETLKTSPVDPAENNMMRISTTATLDARGVLRATTTLTYEGINDNAYRGYFAMLSDHERRNHFEKALRKVVPAASLKGLSLKPDHMLDTGSPLVATLEFTIENYPVKGSGLTLVPVFRFGDTIGLTNHLVSRMGLKERKYTYVTETTCGVEETLTIEIDPYYGPSVGGAFQEASIDGGSSWIRSAGVTGGVLTARNIFQLKLTEYSPEQYTKLQDTLMRVEKANRFMPALAPSSAAVPGAPWFEGFSPDAVILDDTTEVSLLDRSTVREAVERKIRVITYAGKKNLGEIRIPYNPVWEEVGLEKAVVVSPSGETKEIDPREINVMDQEWVGMAPRYPAGKILVASLPALQEGSTIEYRYVRVRRDTPAFLITGVFQGDEPIERKRLRINLPDGLDLHIGKADGGFHGDYAWSPFPDGFIAETRTREGGRDVFEYSVSAVPPVKPEDNLPPGYSFKPTVLASSETIGELSARLGEALERAAGTSARAARTARELTGGLTDEEQRIVAIRDYVAQGIKHVGISLSQMPLSMVSPADTTLADGYGHRVDSAVLLGVMLRAIGYDPEFVLVFSAPPIEALRRPCVEFPSLEWFSTVLVKIGTSRGPVYLGDTDQYAVLGTVANQGKTGLNLSTNKIETIDVRNGEYRDRTNYHVTIDLDAQGDALVTHRRTYHGMDCAGFLKDYRELTPEELRRRYQEIVTSTSRSAVARGPYDVSGGPHPVIEEFTVSIPAYAVRQGEFMTLELPALTRGLSFVAGDERINPLYLASSRKHHIVVEVTLPEGTEVVRQPPEQRVFASEGMGRITLTTRSALEPVHDGQPGRAVIRVEQMVENMPGFMLPDRYVELLSLHRALSSPAMRTIVWKTKPGLLRSADNADTSGIDDQGN